MHAGLNGLMWLHGVDVNSWKSASLRSGINFCISVSFRCVLSLKRRNYLAAPCINLFNICFMVGHLHVSQWKFFSPREICIAAVSNINALKSSGAAGDLNYVVYSPDVFVLVLFPYLFVWENAVFCAPAEETLSNFHWQCADNH